MRKKIRILLLSQLCLFHIVFAQTKTVTGKVTDENGNPIVKASVLVKGTNKGTATNDFGVYSISASANSYLVFSASGMTSKEVAVNNRSVIDMSLKVVNDNLDEVIVVAYGTAKKATLLVLLHKLMQKR